MRIESPLKQPLSHTTAAMVLGLHLLLAAPAVAQFIDNPVYLDDSTTAHATLERLDELIARGSMAEAVRAIQQLLDEEADRLLPSLDHPEVYISVRRRVHEAMLDRPELLLRYRESQEPSAAESLERGGHDEVERVWLLTRSGFEAALRVAQLHLESARFDAARRTLESLDQHPDFDGDRAVQAAQLAELVARYADDSPSRSLAARWSAASGRPSRSIDPVPTPPRAHPPSANAATGEAGWTGRPILVETVLPDPLESVKLTSDDAGEELGRTSMLPAAWTMPASAGDLLYLNDGETISAWDRFTFRPVWRVHTVDDREAPRLESILRARRDSLGRTLEDPTSVTIHGDTLLAVTGRANAGERRGDPRLHAIDRHTGARRWSIDPEAAHTSLVGGSIRGPVIVSDGVVVVAVRKMLRRRRLVSVLLVGFDLGTGETRWVRQIASTGSLPFQQFSPLPVGLAEHDGVVYLTDILGTAAAVEAATGRALWVTRLASDPIRGNRARHVWTAANPVPADGTLILITPDGKSVARIDAKTGVEISSRAASDFGEPAYLMRAGPWLAAVGTQSVAITRVAHFETDEIRHSPPVDEPGIRGRVVPAGDTLTLPVSDGLLLIDPANPLANPRHVVPLTRSGNALVLEGQAVIVDHSSAYNFLAWEIASTLLERRLRENPEDPGPALIYAELAFRAGKIGKLIEITDRAIAAVDGLASEEAKAARSRLFEALAPMVAPAPVHASWDSTLDAAVDTPVIEDAEVIAELLKRLGRLASSPTQRVVHLLAWAELEENRGAPAEALERYQRVLSDPQLAQAQWRGGQLVVRAQLEAQRRLEALLRTHGLGVYAGFERAAEAEAMAVDPANVQQLREVASRYPAAGVTPSLWLRAGLSRLGGEETHEAIRDFRAGLAVVNRRSQAGAQTDGETVAELYGRLVSSLLKRDQIEVAARVLSSAAEAEVVPTLDGKPAEFSSAVSGSGLVVELPSLGRALSGTVSLLPGEPLVPLVVTPRAPRGRVLLLSPVAGTLSLADQDEATGELKVRWSRPISKAVPIVLRSDAESLVLLRPRLNPGTGGVLESIDTATGEATWRALSFDESARGAAPTRGGRVTLSTGDQVAMSQLLVLVEDTTAVLLERSGRAVAYDLIRGTVIWAVHLGLSSVIDAVLSDGVLLVGGNNAEEGAMGPTPSLVMVDARSGDVLQRIDGLSSPTRWIRSAGLGIAVVGLRGSVLAIELQEGQPLWSTSDAPVRDSTDAWVVGRALTVLTAQGTPWMIDLETGRLRAEPLETNGRLSDRTRLRVGEFGGRTVLSTDHGVAVFGQSGRLVGLDPFDTRRTMLPGVLGRGVLALVTVENVRGLRPGIELHLLDAATGKLLDTQPIVVPPELRTLPVSVHAIDGAVLVGFGSSTMVVKTE